MIVLLRIIFFLAILIICTNKFIETQFYFPASTFKLIFKVGNFHESLVSSIDLTRDFSLAPLEKVRPTKNDLIKFNRKLNINYSINKTIEVIEYVDTFSTDFNDKVLVNFPVFLHEEKSPSKFTGFFGFSANFDNESLSIVHSLYNNHIIERRQFGIAKERSSFEGIGKLYFGGVPDNVYQKNHGKCKVKPNSKKWKCEVEYVEVDGNKYYIPKKDEQYFQLNNVNMNVPDKFLIFLINILKKDFGDNCIYHHWDKEKDIRCNNDYISHLPNITFGVGDYEMTYTFNELIEPGFEMGNSYFKFNPSYGENTWIFGKVFLQKFVTVFDYDNEEIVFYGADIIYRKYYKIKVNLFIILTILLVTTSFVIFVTRNQHNYKINST